ncbi:hypothetical protein MTBBW1_2380039 [Desulfamplus magnetovallimortis]|uniref:Uncharacterized protein n=1 Tax=Desulfamplus magnetovallimortis TaxID=1246637 RepID=A0A1W1HEB4_9BACT|nr:hypothetical protein MTBBW1_2380039 [Desulfamplus magnetovallimortis]
MIAKQIKKIGHLRIESNLHFTKINHANRLQFDNLVAVVEK